MRSTCVLVSINFDKHWDKGCNDLLSPLSFVVAARFGTTILLQKLNSLFLKLFFQIVTFRKIFENFIKIREAF